MLQDKQVGHRGLGDHVQSTMRFKLLPEAPGGKPRIDAQDDHVRVSSPSRQFTHAWHAAVAQASYSNNTCSPRRFTWVPQILASEVVSLLVFKPHEFMLLAGGTVFAPYYHTTHENRSIDLPFLMILGK
ncbi:hypothetical protein BKA82DRAFT_1006798 [Pisolithus tinctorius]|uniref:Uncharacterized protein n=1 Tax=Pisolithus tinctorius Marx 270 TaxID=870435 RepID=A0A0C3NCF0_PISTI|nr:hypothetical protein BKA82DRAFT_1006798 [Pisolithus tinctorius]KIN93505.1 hypothetical protein M404DRAFT_1008887 [Pisolithus tinctorius Marx 270]KIN96410.1 hypothetical protein M404DRAFT_1006798 [Pisolithus tinctorius Marx 270]